MVFQFKVRICGGAYFNGEKVSRVFEIAGAKTLEDLCGSILDSVDFSFDHLYEFEIGNRVYEGAPFFAPASERCRIKLYSVGLKKGDRFFLTYDLGDSWRFEIVVADVLDKAGKETVLLSSEGKVDQYPDAEDDLDRDWDEDESWDMGDDDIWEEDFEDEEDTQNIEWNYCAPDALYEAAFRYKRTGLWKKLRDSEIFALRFSDGRMGYISIMGLAGEHCALGLYLGTKGLDSFRIMAFAGEEDRAMEEDELLMQQDCLQLVFDSKEFLYDEETAAVRKYADAHGIRLAGKNAFPHFLKFKPFHYPWYPTAQEEEQDLLTAINAAIFLARNLEQRKASEIGFTELTPLVEQIPCIEESDDGFRFTEKAVIPGREPVAYPRPASFNMVAIQKIRKKKEKGILECQLIRYPEAVQNASGEAPYFPVTLMCADTGTGMVLPPELVEDYEDYPERATDPFLAALAEAKYRPSELHVADERTYALLEPIAEALGVRLKMESILPVLDEFRAEVFESGNAKRLKSIILEVVENQLQDGEPEVTTSSYQRLLAAGYSKKEAKERIASVVAAHIFDGLSENRPFDEKSFADDMNRLE